MNGQLIAVERPVRRYVRAFYVDGWGGRRLSFSMPARVRRAFRRPRKISPAEWAARHFIVGEDSARPGLWRNETTPYLVGVMSVYGLPYVREVYLVAPPQTGKTALLLVCMASDMDQDPGPMMLVMDSETTSREMMEKRVQPMIRASRRLRRLMTGREDDMSTRLVTLQTAVLYPAWATSISRLANKAIKRLYGSEVDKWPSAHKTEAGALSLARKRVRTFKYTSKVLLESSPSVPTGPIWQAYADAEARFVYYGRCPLCGMMQHICFTRPDGRPALCWPDGERDHVKIQSQDLAWYECEHCGGRWDDHLRDRAVLLGEWREQESGRELTAFCNLYRPRTVGFQYSALVSGFVPLSEVAAAFVKANERRKVGDLEPLRDFMNGYLAEPWVEDIQQRDMQTVLALRDERPAGRVPGGGVVATLLGTADTQDDGFWYEIRAWGWGQDRESWQVRTGFVETLDALERIFWDDDYSDAQGNRYVVEAAGIDAMGHRTDEVYEWCVKNRERAVPMQGVDSRRMLAPWEWSKPIEFYPGSQRVIPGSLRLLRIKSDHYKSMLSRKLHVDAGDPGAWHMSADMPDGWAVQLCAEYKDPDGHWQCPKGRDNHAWDVSYYQLALADMLGVRHWLRPDEVPPATEPPAEKRSRPVRQRRARW
jgi:phage terminase large subunit GpA-like protein